MMTEQNEGVQDQEGAAEMQVTEAVGDQPQENLKVDAKADEQVGELNDEMVEAQVWRERAEESAEQLARLARSLAAAEEATAQLQRTVDEVARGRLVDVALLRAGVSDLDAARAAVDSALREQKADEQQSEQVMCRVVNRLRRERPGLFSGSGAFAAHASGIAGEVGHADEAVAAAEQARTTGDPRQLLRYLRLRRRSD